MIRTVSGFAVLTLATVTVLLPRILRGRTNRIADWNWRWILAVMFFLPLALLYIMVWIEMLRGALPGFDPHELGLDLDLEEQSIEGGKPEEYAEWVSLHIRRERQWANVLEALTILGFVAVTGLMVARRPSRGWMCG